MAEAWRCVLDVHAIKVSSTFIGIEHTHSSLAPPLSSFVRSIHIIHSFLRVRTFFFVTTISYTYTSFTTSQWLTAYFSNPMTAQRQRIFPNFHTNTIRDAERIKRKKSIFNRLDVARCVSNPGHLLAAQHTWEIRIHFPYSRIKLDILLHRMAWRGLAWPGQSCWA